MLIAEPVKLNFTSKIIDTYSSFLYFRVIQFFFLSFSFFPFYSFFNREKKKKEKKDDCWS